MQILLANAKIMYERSDIKPWSEPQYQEIANRIALDMAGMDIDTLERELDCSRKLAAENWQRYQNFFIAEKMPAIMAYNAVRRISISRPRHSMRLPSVLLNVTCGLRVSYMDCCALWMV